VGHAVGVAQRVLKGHVAAERVPEHGPLLKTQVLAQCLGVCGEVSHVIDETGTPTDRPLQRWSSNTRVNWSAHRRNAPIVHRSALGPPCISTSGSPCPTTSTYRDTSRNGTFLGQSLAFLGRLIILRPSRTRPTCHQSTRTRRAGPEAKACPYGPEPTVIQLPLRQNPRRDLSFTSGERPRRAALRWSTIGTTTARSDVPEVRKDRRLSRGERHAGASVMPARTRTASRIAQRTALPHPTRCRHSHARCPVRGCPACPSRFPSSRGA
jgi:hypothetical protein